MVVDYVAKCIICSEDVLVGSLHVGPTVCEHCKLAVMEMRKQLNASCGNCAIKELYDDNKYWCPVVGDYCETKDSPCRWWKKE